MAVAGAFHRLYTLKYDATDITGCLGMSWGKVGSQPVSLIAGDGIAVHYVVDATAVQGAFIFHSPIEAGKMADKIEVAKDVTFLVDDEVDVAGGKQVTIANIKTGAVQGGAHNLAGAGPWSVPFVADSVSDPSAP